MFFLLQHIIFKINNTLVDWQSDIFEKIFLFHKCTYVSFSAINQYIVLSLFPIAELFHIYGDYNDQS